MRQRALVLSTVGMIALVIAGQTVLRGQRAPNIRTLTEQEMLDMMQGSSIQASRSSNTAQLYQRVKEAIAGGSKFTMMSADDLPDDWTVAVPVGVGGGGAWD